MAMRTFFRAIWTRWARIARAIGTFQAHVFLTVLYAVLLPAFALIARVVSDPLQLRRGITPRWLDRPGAPATLAEGRRQFS